MCRCRFVFAAMLFMSASAMAAYVIAPITNSSFEDPAAGKIKGWNGENGADISGWSSDVAAFDSGVEGPDAWPGNTDGVYAGFLLGGMSPWGSTYPEPSVWQDLGYTIQAGDQFAVAVDSRDNWSEVAPAQLLISLYYVDGVLRVPLAIRLVPLDGTQGTPVPNEDPWRTYVLNIADASAGVGKVLGIELANIAQLSRVPPGNTWIGIDNVRFVPEPTTLVLLTLGGLCLRRRKA